MAIKNHWYGEKHERRYGDLNILLDCKSGLIGVRPNIKDKNLGMIGTMPEVFPDTRYQRCMVRLPKHFFVTPNNKMKAVSMILMVIHSQESKETAHERTQPVPDTEHYKLNLRKTIDTTTVFLCDGRSQNE